MSFKASLSRWSNQCLSMWQRHRLHRSAFQQISHNQRAKRLLKSLGQLPEAFDEPYYLSQLPVPLEPSESALEHFLTTGYVRGYTGRFFNSAQYEAFHQDVRRLGLDGLCHFRSHGIGEKRQAFFIDVKQAFYSASREAYANWLEKNQALLVESQELVRQKIQAMTSKPLISILMPVYNPPLPFLKAAINSVLKQSYPHWELCIADDCSDQSTTRPYLESLAASDPRIKVVFREKNGHISACSNSALELASGPYIGLLDQDDELDRDALFWVAQALSRSSNVDLIYSDEDKIDEFGNRFDPYFKCEFNYELFLAQNMISHFGVYRTALVRQVGGFRLGLEGSQDHDLALRVLEQSTPENIIHIPRVLYHWRALEGSTAFNISTKSYASEAGLRAIREHLSRQGLTANVEIPDPMTGHYRVRFALQSPLPLVSIIIPTKDRLDLLKVCLESILQKTTYPNIELVILDNGSSEAATLKYLEDIQKRPNCLVIRDDGPFNFSAINNKAVKASTGAVLLFLNNDTEVLTPEWVEAMLSFAQLPTVGCVGARLWYPNESIQHAGVFLGMGEIAGHGHKNLPRGHNGYFNRAVEHQAVSAVTGACLMVRRDLFEKVGGFDVDLAVAFNDVDLCLKARQLGLRNIYVPEAELYHHESISRGNDVAPEKAERFARETALMKKRWGDILKNDPYYSPNLSLDHDDFSIAATPRLVSLSQQ